MAGWQQNLRPKIRLTIDRQTTTDSTCSRSKTFHHKKIAWLLQSHRAQAGDGHVRFVDQVPNIPAGEVCQDFGGVPEHSGVAGREGRLQGGGLRGGKGRTAQLGQGGVFWLSDNPQTTGSASAVGPATNHCDHTTSAHLPVPHR